MYRSHSSSAGFTLIEIMIGILIVSMVMIGGFQALSSVMIGKSRLIQQTNIQKESFYFTERLFEMIKSWGTLDYEEYFNRSVVGTGTTGGHYTTPTGFWNYGDGWVLWTSAYWSDWYFCRSNSGAILPNDGCVSWYNTPSADYRNQPQRYGQYAFQFIDYNSNADGDQWDEDGNGSIIGDDDDAYTGVGPSAFSLGLDTHELYLISADKLERTYFRWKVVADPNAPSSASCSDTTGSGCLGTIEFLKLEGRDYGLDHTLATSDNTQYDGEIDSWYIHPDFTGWVDVLAGSGNIDAYWEPLFPDSVHVENFQVYAYPESDPELAWKQTGIDVAPYVRLQFSLLPSWHTRRALKWTPAELQFSTTISLAPLLSR